MDDKKQKIKAMFYEIDWLWTKINLDLLHFENWVNDSYWESEENLQVIDRIVNLLNKIDKSLRLLNYLINNKISRSVIKTKTNHNAG